MLIMFLGNISYGKNDFDRQFIYGLEEIINEFGQDVLCGDFFECGNFYYQI